MKRSCDWKEAEAVDFVLGSLPGNRSRRLKEHLRECEKCRIRVEYWRECLSGHEDTVPPPELKQRLRNRWMRWKKHRPFRPSPGFLMPVLGIVFVLLAAGGLLKAQLHDIQYPSRSEGMENTEVLDMIRHPQAVRYQVEPADLWEVEGSVWIKGDSREMLLMVRGLQAMENLDYQAWLVRRDARWNGGIVHLEDDRGMLYFQGDPVNQAENIEVRLEPKGGSRVPTGPKAVLVYLQERK